VEVGNGGRMSDEMLVVWPRVKTNMHFLEGISTGNGAKMIGVVLAFEKVKYESLQENEGESVLDDRADEKRTLQATD